ncbi:MAG: DUF5615 family PIN-like protein [Anaerolineales bacterium]
MSLKIYMDHHVPKAITNGLRLRGIDVLTAYEDGRHMATDAELLDRSTELQRILFSQDDDLLAEAAKRIQNNIPFYGVVYAHQLRVSIGVCIKDIEMIALLGESKDMICSIQFLPL